MSYLSDAVKRPNVLVLYSDQHSARCLGCYGNKEVISPNLDKLADNGIRFDRAYTQNPICTPSRMSFLSGQYVHNFNYYGLMGEAPKNLPTLFSVFKEQGYITGLAGKTHTPSGWLSPYCDDLADGFGYETNRTKLASREWEGVQGHKDNEYNDYLADLGLLDKRDDKIYHEWFEAHGHNAGQGLDARASYLPAEHTIEAWSAQRAKQFIADNHAKEQPFFYWMTVPRPHQTYVPAKKFWDMYDDKTFVLPDNADSKMEGRHKSAQEMQASFRNTATWTSFEPKDFEHARRRVLRGYYANVTQVDAACGEVIDYLDELNIRKDTIILYLTDHGEFAGEHGMIEKAPGIAFHCVTRVPTILSWQGHLPEAKVVSELTESVDWFPSLLSLCDIDIPEYCSGKNLLGLITGDEAVRNYAFTENAFTKTVHSKKYKFTYYLPCATEGQSFAELYDLENDPWELHNLAREEQYQTVVAEHKEALLDWLISTQRLNTISPSITCNDGRDGDWDISNEYLAEDGKVKNSFIQNLIDRKSFKYF